MDLILDTNALSAIAEGEREAAKQFSRAARVAIPVIVLGEYRFGIAHSRHQREYENWLEEMVSVCDVLEVSEETAIWYAELRGNSKTLVLRSLPMTFGLRHSAANIPFPS